MKTWNCVCGQQLFFENTVCEACGAEVGWCDQCHVVSAVADAACATCNAPVQHCNNRVEHQVCNSLVGAELAPGALCRWCARTIEIPNLAAPNALERWRVLEAGKRRLLFGLQEIGAPESFFDGEPVGPPLRFRFAESGPKEIVMTGHADGLITINLVEADAVHRETAKRDFNEPQRTVIGHFRHEVGHYFWQRLVVGAAFDDAKRLFGDPDNPPYADALAAYHDVGPAPDWRSYAISAYATAHPWEDFAETTAFYLDMRAVLDTTAAVSLALTGGAKSAKELLSDYTTLGIQLNEVNRTMGLTDLVPEVVPPPVVEKLEFVHALLQNCAEPTTERAG